jgi:tetratricopeptide (TPR) repeat protein
VRPTTPSSRRRPHSGTSRISSLAHLLSIIIIAIVGLLVYSSSFDGDLVFDDIPHIAGSRDLHDLADVKRWWNHDPRRPIGYATLALNYNLNGLDVRSYHVTNTFIHIASAAVVYWLLLLTLARPVIAPRLETRTRHVLSLLGALLFLVHPVQTQAVSYIIQRLASLATLFYLLSLALYVHARVHPDSGTRRVLAFAGSAVAGILAMLTKENAFTLPLAIGLYELVFLSPAGVLSRFRDARVWLAAGVLAAGLLVVPALLKFDASRVFAAIPPEHGHTYTVTPLMYFLTQCRVLLTYIRLLVLPVNQMLDYDYPVATEHVDVRSLLSFVLLVAIVAFALWRLRRDPLLGFGLLWFFLTLAVESSFIPIADVIFEHRLYLAMFGFVLVVLSLVVRWPLPRATRVLAVVVILLAIVSHQRNRVWRDGVTLWADVVRKAPNNVRANTNLGNEYVRRNQPAQADPYLNRAVAINPNYGEGHTNLGAYYRERGQVELAEKHLTRAVSLVPDNTTAQYNLGTFYLGTRRTVLAEQHLKQAIALAPEFAGAYTNLGLCMYEAGKDDSSIVVSERAIALNPAEFRAYTNLGRTWKRKGDLQKAVRYYEQAYALQPRALDNIVNLGNAALAMQQYSVAEDWYKRALAADQRYARGLNGMGLVNYYRGDYAAAVRYLEDARASDPNLADTYNNLFLCYTALGRTQEAAASFEAAARLRQ